ncbi:uncharacterized protein C16orf46 homolog [Centroberyx gerrardi]
MATLKEFDQAAVEGSDKEFPEMEDTGWDRQPCTTPDQDHVDALLDISEENFLKEQEPYEYHCFSGWEEAVRGWGRVTPLACMFLPQKKGKKPKTGEPDHHCLLCVDLKLSNVDSSAGCPEYRCEPYADPHDSSLKKTTPLSLRVRTYSHTAASAPAAAAPECPVLTAMQTATQHLLLREKIVEDEKLRVSQQPSSPLLPHHLASKYPMFKNRPARHNKQTHRPTNIVLSINSFTVLPPVKSPQLKPQKVSGQLCNDESAVGGETSQADSVISAKESGGVERGGETRADTVVNPEIAKDTYGATLTSKYCTCQHKHHLLSAFSVSIPKRYEVPLTSKADTVHRTSYSMGKHVTQALRPSGGCSRYTGPSAPQLPILFGTKVPMPASQKLL